jgi:hypothetical protein
MSPDIPRIGHPARGISIVADVVAEVVDASGVSVDPETNANGGKSESDGETETEAQVQVGEQVAKPGIAESLGQDAAIAGQNAHVAVAEVGGEIALTEGAFAEGGVLQHATGPRLSLVTATSIERQQATTAAMDRLSLEQALLDVEVANARVLDLTARLVEANQRAASLRGELDGFRMAETQAAVRASVEREAQRAQLDVERAQLAAQQAHLEVQKSSTAYRWAAKVWNLRNAIRN